MPADTSFGEISKPGAEDRTRCPPFPVTRSTLLFVFCGDDDLPGFGCIVELQVERLGLRRTRCSLLAKQTLSRQFDFKPTLTTISLALA